MRVLVFFAAVMILSCGCPTAVDEPAELLVSAKRNSKERVCRLVKRPVVAAGVYCVVHEGPEFVKNP